MTRKRRARRNPRRKRSGPKRSPLLGRKHHNYGSVKAHRRRVNPRKKRRGSGGRRHRNPRFFKGMGFLSPITSNLDIAAWGVLGFAGNRFIPQYLPYIKDNESSPAINYLGKALTTLGISFLAGRFIGSRAATGIAVGGIVEIGVSAINDFAPGTAAMLRTDLLSGAGLGTIGRYRALRSPGMGEIIHNSIGEIIPNRESAPGFAGVGNDRFQSRF